MRLDSAFADRVTAFVLFLLGSGAAYGGFVMDRLEIRKIHPASIPGLVPMILGAALMVCALALAWSARGRDGEPDDAGAVSWTNLALVAVWSGLYALAAVGNMPFELASGVYIAGFTLWFLWTESPAGRRPGPATVAGVIVFAALAAIGIAALFRDGFLVRLP